MKKCFTFLPVTMVLTTFSAFAASEPTSGIRFSADKTVQDKTNNTVELIGNARVTKGEQEVIGQRIILNTKTGVAKVDGAARYTSNAMTVDLSSSAANR